LNLSVSNRPENFISFCLKQFLPVIYQVKNSKKSQVLVLLGGGGGKNKNHAGGLGFVEKKILRILAGTARVVVHWFSQYTCLKVQNFAIMGQL
jgi:hypothetical protein